MISIRLAKKDEMTVLKEIYENAAEAQKPAALDDSLFDENNVYLFYENEQPAAFSSCALREGCIEITSLYVRDGFQGRGYARLLLKHMEGTEPGSIKRMMLQAPENAESMQFFQKQGYQADDETDAVLYKTVKGGGCCCKEEPCNGEG